MSSQTDFVALLSLVQTNLYRFGGPILAFLGTVSSLLNLIVFTQKNLRKNPCSMYLIAFNISNFFLIYSAMSATILDLGYKINPSSYNLIYCRFRSYVIFLFESLSTSYLLLASIDRVLITSSNAVTRRRITCYLAYKCIIGITIFWILFHIHAFVLTDILQTGLNSYACYFRPGWYPIFVGYYSLLKGIIIPLLLFIFAIITVKNIRNIRHVAPAHIPSRSGNVSINGTHSTNAKDKQLILMLFVDIVILLIFTIAFAMILMYQQITQYQLKTAEQKQNELFIRYVISFTAYIPFCVSCYIHLLVSKTFRITVKSAFTCN